MLRIVQRMWPLVKKQIGNAQIFFKTLSFIKNLDVWHSVERIRLYFCAE